MPLRRAAGFLFATVILYGLWAPTVASAITITEFTVPTAGSVPYGITAGPDGNLWFTERDGNKIGVVQLVGVPAPGTLLLLALGSAALAAAARRRRV